jgi:hypothetical protein
MANYNEISSNQVGSNIRGSYGGLPVAEKNQSYFVYFNGAGGTGPEIIGQTAFFCSYIIDEVGNIAVPNQNSNARLNVIQNFEIGKKVDTKMEQPTIQFTELNGQNTITGVGTITNILFTETGSSPGAYTSSLEFQQGGGSAIEGDVDNYIFSAKKSTEQNVDTVVGDNLNVTASFENVLISNNNFAITFDSYSFDNPADTIDGGTPVRFLSTLKIRNYSAYNAEIGVTIIDNDTKEVLDNQNGVYFVLNAPYLGLNDYTEQSITLTTPFRNFTNNQNIAVRIIVEDESNYTSGDIRIAEGSTFKSLQKYSTTNVITSTPYWEIGDYTQNPTVITASAELSGLYNGGYRQSQSFDSDLEPGFNFNPIRTNFDEILIGDRIRFEYNEDKRFNISKIIENGPDGRLCFQLDGQVLEGTELNHFLLYRLANDAAYVIVDVEKDIAGSTGGGLMIPQFISTELEKNFDNILADLKDKDILQNDLSFNDETT